MRNDTESMGTNLKSMGRKAEIKAQHYCNTLLQQIIADTWAAEETPEGEGTLGTQGQGPRSQGSRRTSMGQRLWGSPTFR